MRDRIQSIRSSQSSFVIAPVWIERAIFVWVATITVLLCLLFHNRGFDDPYITYRYAANLAQGNGLVYNVGERTLSTTAPLYALLLAPFAWSGLDLPLASNTIGCLSLALGGLALWRLGQIWRTPLVGLVGLLLYPTFSLPITTLGAETVFSITLILYGFLAVAKERYRWAAIWLALATLARADGVLAVGVAGIFIIATRLSEPGANRIDWRKLGAPEFYRALPWDALAIYAAILLPWFTFAWLYFGSPFPVTLAVKQHQGAMAISQSFLAGLWGQIQTYWHVVPYRLHFGLAGIGLLYASWKPRPWLLILGWSALYLAAYAWLGVSAYFWYYAPLSVGWIALVGLGITAISQAAQKLLSRRGNQRLAVIAAGVLIAALVGIHANSLARLSALNDQRLGIYRAVGAWLRADAPPDASIGTLEVGIIGYYAERRMIDFAGLLQPDTARQLTPTTTYEDAAIWAFEHYQPDYLALQQGIFPRLEQNPLFVNDCREREQFRDERYPHAIVVYRCAP